MDFDQSTDAIRCDYELYQSQCRRKVYILQIHLLTYMEPSSLLTFSQEMS